MDKDDLAIQANSYASANGIQVEKKASGDSDKTIFEGAPKDAPLSIQNFHVQGSKSREQYQVHKTR